MKNRTVTPLWAMVALLGVTPVVGLILAIFYQNVDVFYATLSLFFLPILVIFLIIVAFNIVLHFIQRRSLQLKNKINSN
jgi:flagellar biosynthesis protein FliQ